MYILIKDDVPDHMVPVISAHVSLGTYLEFQHLTDMQDWLKNSFRKVVVKVNQKEFDNMKNSEYNRRVFTESALDGMEVAIGCVPTEQEKPFKFYKLWKPKRIDV